MIYIFEQGNYVLDSSIITEQQKSEAIVIAEKPKIEHIEGKKAILKWDKKTQKAWYEYEDTLETKEDLSNQKIQELEQQLLELQEYIINKEAEELLNQGGM